MLDIFCGAGGCSRGYQQAGFSVVGCDIVGQPRYIGDDFILMDGIGLLERLVGGEVVNGYRLCDFVAVHASPPCQGYSRARYVVDRETQAGYSDLIGVVRELLKRAERPYVIENVPGAPLVDPVVLNGAMFGLLVQRVRLFECSFYVPFFLLPQLPRPVKMGRKVVAGQVIQPVGHFQNVEYARQQMGIDWMVQDELTQAIPPAYTEFIGRRLMEHITAKDNIG